MKEWSKMTDEEKAAMRLFGCEVDGGHYGSDWRFFLVSKRSYGGLEVSFKGSDWRVDEELGEFSAPADVMREIALAILKACDQE